jgi:hypothetical protein
MPTLKAHFSGALLWEFLLDGFWANLTGAGVATPRHNYMQVLTIDKMLGFEHVDPISCCEIFSSVVFSFNPWLMRRMVMQLPNIWRQ